MSIRLRITLLLLTLFLLYGGADLAIRQHLVWPSFTEWAQQAAMEAARRFEQQVDQELADLQQQTRNWAQFNTLVNYSQGLEHRFVEQHLGPTLFERANIDLIAVYSANGQSLVQRYRQAPSADLRDQLTPHALSPIHRLRVFDQELQGNEQHKEGVLITTRGPWLLATRPIYDARRDRVTGTLVLGRALNAQRVVAYSQALRTPLSINWRADVAPIEGSGFALSSLNQRYQELPSDKLQATRTLVSADGHGTLELSAVVDRNHITQGLDRARQAWLYAGAVGLGLLLIGGWLLNRSIVQPIQNLSRLMQRVVDKGDYSLRPRLRRRDEIGQLANVFEEMMTRVEGQQAAKHLQSQRLEKLAGTDALTGVANRRSLEQYLEQSWSRSRQQRLPMSVILCDIDHFKLYNDHYGHLAGDECLRQVAEAMGRQLHRQTDMLFRYGGEEFAVVLPATDLEGAERLAEKLRRSVLRSNIPHAKSPAGSVTLSLGVASATGGDAPSRLLLDAADRALYDSKEAGRNRVSISAPVSEARKQRRNSDGSASA